MNKSQHYYVLPNISLFHCKTNCLYLPIFCLVYHLIWLQSIWKCFSYCLTNFMIQRNNPRIFIFTISILQLNINLLATFTYLLNIIKISTADIIYKKWICWNILKYLIWSNNITRLFFFKKVINCRNKSYIIYIIACMTCNFSCLKLYQRQFVYNHGQNTWGKFI